MPDATIISADVYEDSGPILMARVVGTAGAAITQATCSTITYAVYDVATAASVTSGSLTIANVVFDTLQTDAIWTKDSTGYNFKTQMTAAMVPTGGATYRMEIKITPTSGQPIWLVYQVSALALYTS